MDVSLTAWLLLIAVVLAIIIFDFVTHVRKPHVPSIKEATAWSVSYIGLAVAFGLLIWWAWGLDYAGQYWAGWITEWSLSIDNLFVFLLIFSAFQVPRQYQQKVLLIGIALALLLRGIFIAVGSAVISQFSWIFYIFGAFLIYTAITQLKPHAEEESYSETWFVKLMRKIFPTTEGYEQDKVVVRKDGKTYITPMLIVIVAVGSADLMFAFDSIPAIFGLTNEAYIVFAANAFSLLGLRQFFFLIDGLMEKLVFLNYGLGIILGFIGVKLLIHAGSENTLPFINSGQPIHILPEPSTVFSMTFIVVVLLITTIASVIYSKVKK